MNNALSRKEIHHLICLRKDPSYREEQRRVFVEGKNLLLDLLQRHTPHKLFVTQELQPLFAQHPHKLIDEKTALRISDVRSPEGCFAEFDLPQNPSSKVHTALVLDRLQDPGNMGTLLRTALAFGLSNIFLIQPCCDPWNPKAIRAAKGAQFDLALTFCSWNELPNLPVIIADTQGTALSHHTTPKEWLLVLGNEAHGPCIPQHIKATSVTIEIKGPVESLNVAQAGAILLHYFTQ